MVAAGVTRRGCPPTTTSSAPCATPPSPLAAGSAPRAAAALELWRERLAGAVVAIGNAPTALFHLLEMIDDGAPRPAAVLGVPVGFIGAAESKDALAARDDLPYLVVHGRRGAAARSRPPPCQRAGQRAGDRGRARCLRRRRRPRRPRAGHGQGRPADRRRRRDRLPPARHGRSIARAVAEPYLRGDQIEEALVYPVTTETTDHPGGYQGAIDEFYDEAAERLAAHLDAGRDVVVLAEGDPLFYGSYMHMHKRLAHRYPTEVVPGDTSISAASAAVGQPLVERDEVLTVLPGTLPAPSCSARLADTDSAAVLKLGRTFDRRPRRRRPTPGASPGRLRRARHDRPEAHRCRWPTSTPARCPTSLIALLPARSPRRPAASHRTHRRRGEVVVVGTRPGRAGLADARGAGRAGRGRRPRRLRPLPGPRAAQPRPARHPATTGSRPTAPRTPWTWPPPGARVAVVSSGDPGVFAMAAAVLEVAEQEKYADVPVRVLPGLTASRRWPRASARRWATTSA